ncbi:MAG: hypothetical protein ACRELA_14465, partial [Candidatus Rokuibacteriota bacterium]
SEGDMECPTCHQAVPDESLFCLHCGMRLSRPERVAPVNGGGTPQPGSVAAPASAQDAASPAVLDRKQPYALSFKPLSDDRLRYRVARWVCEVAPAHPIGEVQESLTRGDFATFLALTPEEAETARRRIEALGVHPALLSLAPATAAALLLPARQSSAKDGEASWTTKQKFAAVGIVTAMLFAFGFLMIRMMYGGP